MATPTKPQDETTTPTPAQPAELPVTRRARAQATDGKSITDTEVAAYRVGKDHCRGLSDEDIRGMMIVDDEWGTDEVVETDSDPQQAITEQSLPAAKPPEEDETALKARVAAQIKSDQAAEEEIVAMAEESLAKVIIADEVDPQSEPTVQNGMADDSTENGNGMELSESEVPAIFQNFERLLLMADNNFIKELQKEFGISLPENLSEEELAFLRMRVRNIFDMTFEELRDTLNNSEAYFAIERIAPEEAEQLLSARIAVIGKLSSDGVKPSQGLFVAPAMEQEIDLDDVSPVPLAPDVDLKAIQAKIDLEKAQAEVTNPEMKAVTPPEEDDMKKTDETALSRESADEELAMLAEKAQMEVRMKAARRRQQAKDAQKAEQQAAADKVRDDEAARVAKLEREAKEEAQAQKMAQTAVGGQQPPRPPIEPPVTGSKGDDKPPVPSKPTSPEKDDKGGDGGEPPRPPHDDKDHDDEEPKKRLTHSKWFWPLVALLFLAVGGLVAGLLANSGDSNTTVTQNVTAAATTTPSTPQPTPTPVVVPPAPVQEVADTVAREATGKNTQEIRSMNRVLLGVVDKVKAQPVNPAVATVVPPVTKGCQYGTHDKCVEHLMTLGMEPGDPTREYLDRGLVTMDEVREDASYACDRIGCVASKTGSTLGAGVPTR